MFQPVERVLTRPSNYDPALNINIFISDWASTKITAILRVFIRFPKALIILITRSV